MSILRVWTKPKGVALRATPLVQESPWEFPGASAAWLAPVLFSGDELRLVMANGQPFVAIAPICSALGTSAQMQLKKLKKHPVFAKGVILRITPSGGGDQETWCIKLGLLAAWLMVIHPNRVKPEARAKLVEYQSYCADVLYKHVLGERERVLGSAYMAEWKAVRRKANRARYTGEE